LRGLANSITVRILQTSLLMFFCYLVIGILLAILPCFIHLKLGLSPVWAGIVVSAQYAATLLSRPRVGLMTDCIGPKATVLWGQVACLLSGILLLLSAFLEDKTVLCVSSLLLSRIALGCSESCIATGTITWGLRRVGMENDNQVISWSGIASYGAMALGAPMGVWIELHIGFAAVGATVLAIVLLNLALAVSIAGVPVLRGDRMEFLTILQRVLPKGLSLALGTVGFGVIASFLTLYFIQQHWRDPAIALVLFGVAFVGTRLAFANTVKVWGGFRVAIASLLVESVGLLTLWVAKTPHVAAAATAISGCGFALVFPALGVEVVRGVNEQNRGTALGIYTAFLDLAMGVTGPIAGYVITLAGYAATFLSASGAAICGCIVLSVILYRMHERPALQLAGPVDQKGP
jgi:predicted MFS family arabinose efflux permease